MRISLVFALLVTMLGCSTPNDRDRYPVDEFIDPVSEVNPFVGAK